MAAEDRRWIGIYYDPAALPAVLAAAQTGPVRIDSDRILLVRNVGAAAATADTGADNLAPGVIEADAAFVYGYDAAGGNWDRFRLFATNTGADNLVPGTTSGFGSFLYGYDGGAGTWDRLLVDTNGGLFVNLDGWQTLNSASDNIAGGAIPAVAAELYSYDAAGGNWDRLRSASIDTGNDNQTIGTVNAWGSALYGWDSVGSNWDRIRVNSTLGSLVVSIAGWPTINTTTDDEAGSTAAPATAAQLYGYDAAGTNWDRLRIFATNTGADNLTPGTVNGAAGFLYAYDGATWDRLRTSATGSLHAHDARANTAYVAHAANNNNVVAAAATLYAGSVTNEDASQRYFQIHNKASAPAGGDVPIFSVPVPSMSELALGPDRLGALGLALDTGLSWGWSSTRGTYTAVAATTFTTSLQYR